MGRINCDELQEMLKGGRTQADCARHFQVSEAAISKAVKRLKAAEVPATMEKLTEKERVFVLNRAEGKTATESALVAYDCKSRGVAKTLGCRMAKDPDIEQALSDIMAQEGIPRRRRIKRLRHLIESKDLTAVSKGLDMSWKLDGSYASANTGGDEKGNTYLDLSSYQIVMPLNTAEAVENLTKPLDQEIIDVSPKGD